jgi:transposase
MNRILAYLLGMALLFLLSTCDTVYAQNLPNQLKVPSLQDTHSKTNQTQKSSQKRPNRCAEERSGQRIPKPERNRLDEGKGKKVPVPRKKKKSRNTTNIKKRKPKTDPAVNEDENHQSAKQRGANKEFDVKTERIDDIPLLIGVMVLVGYQRIIDEHISSHGNQRNLSWGWTAVIWLAYILSEGDHRKVALREYVRGMKNALEQVTGKEIDELDFTDDRLAILLRHFSNRKWWIKIENDLSANSIEVYELPKKIVRCDATTVSGYHNVAEGGIFQYGNSKDDPNRPQIKIMTGSLDPLGMPLATDVVSGEHADDGLYVPVINRINSVLKKSGVLYVGDCKLSSFDNRLHIKGCKGHYLCPLPNTGETAKKKDVWIEEGLLLDEKDKLIRYTVINNKNKEELKTKGYEIERHQSGVIDGKEKKWTERVLIVNSPAYARQKEKGLEKRLQNAAKRIYALTPARGRGKRQITDESELIATVESILKKHKVEGFLSYDYEKEVETKTSYVGKGRGSANRERKTIENIRYQITNVSRNKENIENEIKKYGWKVYVTDVSKNGLGFIDAMKCYRKEYRVERIFNMLKSRLNIAPFFVRRNDQVKGITHFLTLGVRTLTLIEYVIRRSLKKDDSKLEGLHLENPKKLTNIPTSKKLLTAFSKITLTIIESKNSVVRHLTPLSQLQINILERLGLNAATYTKLEIRQSVNILNE